MGAIEIPGFTFSLPANQDSSSEATAQWMPVDVVPATSALVDEAAAFAPVSGTGGQGIGILQNNPQEGEAGDIMVNGISRAYANGVVAIGDSLMNTATGLAKATAGNYQVGKALSASSATGQIISVLLVRNGKL